MDAMDIDVDKTVCGFIRFTNQWFDSDAYEEKTKAFYVYAMANGGQLVSEGLYNHWKSAVQPKYKSRFPETLIGLQDTKSNPRREHPFCRGYMVFLDGCQWYKRGQLDMMPIVIMDKGMERPKNVSRGVYAFQRIWRAKAMARALREDPEVMFDPSLDKAVRRIRAVKCGVSESTLDAMLP
jgi:hypothetical protein